MRLGMPMPMGTPRSILFDIVRPLDDDDDDVGNDEEDGDEEEGGNDDDDGDKDEGGNDDGDGYEDEGENDDEDDGDEDVDEALFEEAAVKEWLAAELSEVERAPKMADGCT